MTKKSCHILSVCLLLLHVKCQPKGEGGTTFLDMFIENIGPKWGGGGGLGGKRRRIYILLLLLLNISGLMGDEGGLG